MSRRSFLYILFVVLALFVGNIFFYNMSEDYQFLIKKLKYKEDVKVITQDDINDNYTLEWPASGVTSDIDESFTDLDDDTQNQEDTTTPDSNVSAEDPEEKMLVLSQNGKDMLNLLWGENTYVQATSLASLFDLTTEYPDEYLEFKSQDTSIYYFGNKKYSEVVDIFFAISQWLPFTINKSNTFWEQSFFINLNPEFNDDVVRIVFESKKEVFWLKIKKDRYNAIKKSLEALKK